MLNVVMLHVVMLNVIMLSIVRLNVVMLSVVAPKLGGKVKRLFGAAIRINQLPISATRWQHGSQVCFATFRS